jgi:methionyl aminopeptidase
VISIKSRKELEIMKKGGKMLAFVAEKIFKNIKSGVSKRQLDISAREEIEKLDAKPSFMIVPGYHWATCITVNEEVVHGVPNEYRLKEGDLVSFDLGIFWKGFHTDLARTVAVGNIDEQKKDFLEAGKLALGRAIRVSRPEAKVGDISKAIEKTIEKKGYRVVRALTGHGIGRELHEEPQIPGFYQSNKGPTLKEGMTLAIEVIYSMGRPEICYKGTDGWTIRTRDNSLSALFEDTIAITKDGPIVLTKMSQL